MYCRVLILFILVYCRVLILFILVYCRVLILFILVYCRVLILFILVYCRVLILPRAVQSSSQVRFIHSKIILVTLELCVPYVIIDLFLFSSSEGALGVMREGSRRVSGCGLCVYQIHAIACTCTIDQSVAMLHIVHIDLVVLTASTNVMVL